jgi:glycosyltransferase involved in cell wall biosynthesis
MTKHSHPTIRQQGKKVTRWDTPRPQIEEVAPEMPRKPRPRIVPKVKPQPITLDVTAIVVNFKTKHLVKQAVQTFRKFYPGVPLLIIDNASRDTSTEWILSKSSETISSIILDTNIGHGPALDLGMKTIGTRYAFAFDSDIKFHHGGFLQKMQRAINGKYAVGWLRWVNRNGVAARGRFDKSRFCPYIHPCFAMFDLEIYKKLKPFVNKGAPLVDNMHDARNQGYRVGSFPFEKYADHLVAGTRRLYFGHWFAKDEQPKQKWNPNAKIPI